MRQRTLIAAVLMGIACSAAPLSAKKADVETLYQEALECRLAAQSVLQVLKKAEPQNDDDAKTVETVDSTEAFYRKLSMMLGRKLEKRDPLIGMDYAKLQLDMAQAILTKPNAMAQMVNRTKTCGEAISEAEKA